MYVGGVYVECVCGVCVEVFVYVGCVYVGCVYVGCLCMCGVFIWSVCM